MLETEPALRFAPLRKNNFGGDQFHQGGFKLVFAFWGNRIKKRKRKLPADNGGNLRGFAGLAEKRSRRAMSEFSRSVAGTAAPSSPADSITLLVNSSANSGADAVGLGDNRRDCLRGQSP